MRLGRQVGGIHAGSRGYVYGLSGHGQAVLDIDGPMGGRRRRVWKVKPAFLDHILAVAEVYVGLVEAKRTDRIELLDFQAEPGCWRMFSGVGGQARLKPDAYVRLGVGELERSAFVEVDLNTESGPTIARKCHAYLSYWRSGIEQGQHGVFPSVVWLALTERRVTQIEGVLRRLPPDGQQLFQAALLTNVTSILTTTAPGGRMA